VNVYFFKEWREFAGLSRGQLAKLMHLQSTSAVSRVESGQRKWTQTFCEDFAKACRCNVWDPLSRRPPVHNHGKKTPPVDAAQFEELQRVLEGHIKRRVRKIKKAVGKKR
jgi:transcriptional regulator with XRE-family HTH domain